ncbi:hypothetical protein CXF85_14155 [Colwellia sp. 75C3]|uniref:hypothetical protein n=1 Tax=Colwellia sp. 75C3 TaxID=888425 RepID=UPI000C343812|nr:hypothetical protein [Colwellia sp. 75C3]PKG82055.1 hypothetical protein CXF85_14155 [Colwellia sp. 75C3]
MNKTSLQRLINISFISLVIFSNLVSAGQITVYAATNYPYKNLINRTDVVKVFYTTTEGIHKCRVEIVLNSMKWTSMEKELHNNVLNDDILPNCLSRDKAEKILFQTFLQFGQGL